MAIFTPNAFGTLLTNVITAVLILLIGFVIGKIAGLLLNKLIVGLSINSHLKKKKKTHVSFAKGLSNIVSMCIYIVTVILALQRLSILNIAIKVVIGIIIVLIVGTIFFAIINFVTNAIFGLNIITSKKFEKGDIVKIKKVEGTVEKIGLVHTRLQTKAGDIFILTNRMFFRNKFSVEKQKANFN
jgi:small conductance mechanosensitive channel